MIKHYDSCTRDYIGRVVLQFLSEEVIAANLEGIIGVATEMQTMGACSCASFRLAAIDEKLRIERKRNRAAGRPADSAVTAELTRQREEIRIAVEIHDAIRTAQIPTRRTQP